MKFTDAKNGGSSDHQNKSFTAHHPQDLIVGRQRTSRNENADYSGTTKINSQTSSSRNNLYKASQKSIGISKQNASSSHRDGKSSVGGQNTT